MIGVPSRLRTIRKTAALARVRPTLLFNVGSSVVFPIRRPVLGDAQYILLFIMNFLLFIMNR